MLKQIKKHHRPNKVRKQRMESEEEGKKIKKRGGKKDMDWKPAVCHKSPTTNLTI